MGATNLGTIDKVLKEIEHLPTLPQVITKILAMTESQDVNAIHLAKAMDQSLTAKVLKVANSAYYGSRTTRQVNSVHHAIVMIGFDAVKEIILTTSFFHTFRGTQEVKTLLPLWKHSLEGAFAAKRLAWVFRYEAMDEAYLVGLIHDIGKLIIQQYFPEQYQAIYGKWNGAEALQAEKDLLGITHAGIGGKMAQQWNFPESLCEAITYHHEGRFKLNPRLGTLLCAANAYVSGSLDFPGLLQFCGKAGMSYPAQWKDEDLQRVQGMLHEEIGKASNMLDISNA